MSSNEAVLVSGQKSRRQSAHCQGAEGGCQEGAVGKGLCVPLQPLVLLIQVAFPQFWPNELADGLIVAIEVLYLQREKRRGKGGEGITLCILLCPLYLPTWVPHTCTSDRRSTSMSFWS